MRKIIAIAIVLGACFTSILGISEWFHNDLYVRIPVARVEYQGIAFPKGELYRSQNGTLMLFLPGENTHFPLYIIILDETDGSVHVGTVASENPFKNILQVKMGLFALCVNCETYLGFPDNFRGTAGLTDDVNNIHFSVYQDQVDLHF